VQANGLSHQPLAESSNPRDELSAFYGTKVQKRRPKKLTVDFPLPTLFIRQMEKVIRTSHVSNTNVGNISQFF